MSSEDQKNENGFTKERIAECISMLELLVDNNELLATLAEDEKIALMIAAGKLSRPDRKEIRKRNRTKNKMNRRAVVAVERDIRAATGIRSARDVSVFTAPKQISESAIDKSAGELHTPRNCYVCKAEYTRLHFFYDAMCPSCAEFNYRKRFQTASLKGQVALITGARLKIGYHATLMMLRAGAEVIALTRFPVDAALRYTKEEDYPIWKDKIHVYGLDLRHTPSVELFADYIERTYDRLDILINNAAQTVRRPPGFYAHLIDMENKDFAELPKNANHVLRHFQACREQLMLYSATENSKGSSLPVTWNVKSPGIGLRSSAQLSQIPYAYDQALDSEKVFPKGQLDVDLQQVDLRETNSWRLRLGEIPTSEMLEIQLVNAVAPFVLCNRLTHLMKKDNTGKKHIVNVSAMEGKFFRFKKGERHPHTNMAKAALNMMTHTSASELAKYGIYMNAVDTGWVTDEDPVALTRKKEALHDFQPPLDIVDGAARICDPFFDGIQTGKHWCGQFLKDYHPIDW
jgi:NAD(P)-dependent dehydrogenase (short-subunit alcohol dehydrogenase family)